MRLAFVLLISLPAAWGASASDCSANGKVTFASDGVLTCTGNDCANCEVDCASFACEVKCEGTSVGGCFGMKVTCSEGKRCKVQCDADQCIEADLICGESGDCELLCDGLAACRLSTVTQSTQNGGDFRLDCNAYDACHQMTVECPTGGLCTITAVSGGARHMIVRNGENLQLDCSGNLACEELDVTISGDANIVCGTLGCSKTRINAQDGKMLALACSGADSCSEASVNCPATGVCGVNCSAGRSCPPEIDCGSGGGASCTLTCGVHASCWSTRVIHSASGIVNPPPSTTVVNCYTDACIGAHVVCTPANRFCTTNCIGDRACKALEFDCSSDTVSHCSLTCQSVVSAAGLGSCDVLNLKCPANKPNSCGVSCEGEDTCQGLASDGLVSPISCSPASACTEELLRTTPTPITPTSTPSTVAPLTNPPRTSAPSTNAPATPAPQTSAPLTSAPPTTAPQTNAPVTPAPLTNAPPTSPPLTAAPQTNAPLTTAPRTSAPPTSAPPTTAPQTSAPLTNAPPTTAPQTSAPLTTAPQTSAPPTSAPLTIAPQTSAPLTQAPHTIAPQTSAPPTAAPQTSAPQTSAPPTTAPQTSAPLTSAPPTTAPQTSAPLTSAPPTTAPQTSAPFTSAPLTSAPPTTAPQTSAPFTSAPLTSAPPTTAPQTDAPLTSAPPTIAPQTSAPLTSAPGTPAPQTSAPQTSAPPTDAPLTHALLTSAPFTRSPPSNAPSTKMSAPLTTLSPPTHAPQKEAPTPAPTTLSETQAKQLDKVSDAAAGAGIATGSSVGLKLVVLKNFGCQVEDVDLEEAVQLDWEFHPTKLAFGTDRRKFMTAAILMNPALVVVFWVLLAVISASFYFTRQNITWSRATSMARSPGLIALPFMFLIQGTSLVSARLAFQPKGLWLSILGWGIMAFCTLSPGMLFLFLRRVPACSLPIPDPILFPNHPTVRLLLEYSGLHLPKKPLTGVKRKLYQFAFGDIVWVSRAGHKFFAEKYGTLYEGYRPGCSFYMSVEVTGMIMLSLLSAWQPGSKTECNVRNLVICLLFVALTLLVCVLRPFNSVLDNLVSLFLTAGMCVAVVLMTVSIWHQGEVSGSMSGVAGWLLILTAFVVFIKALWDLCVYAVDIYMERRHTARNLANENTGVLESLGYGNEEPVVMKTFIEYNEIEVDAQPEYYREDEVLSEVASRRYSQVHDPADTFDELLTPSSCLVPSQRRGSTRGFLAPVPSEGSSSSCQNACNPSPPTRGKAMTPTGQGGCRSIVSPRSPRFLSTSPRALAQDDVLVLPLVPMERQVITPTLKQAPPRDLFRWV
ncbi:hypothetical protein DIPPA_02155 [Diplonema papillatum]|nr:hypothetical protein DIPPA_02155 [Diplonema papillatum]